MSEMFDELEYIKEIDKAINKLKSKEILMAITNQEKTFFVGKKEKVMIYNPNSTYSLKYEEFKELYNNVVFVVYNDNEAEFDFSRDDEYYNNWKHK